MDALACTFNAFWPSAESTWGDVFYAGALSKNVLCKSLGLHRHGWLRGSKDEAERKTREEGERERALEAGALGMASHEAAVDRKLLSLTLISTPAALALLVPEEGVRARVFAITSNWALSASQAWLGERLPSRGFGVVARVRQNAQAPLA